MDTNTELEIRNILAHKEAIATYMAKFCAELSYRAAVHDNSKFDPQEFDVYAQHIQDFNKHPFGSPEDNALRDKIISASLLHRKHNRHHPEFFRDGLDGMNLIDLLEMIIDWKAATERCPHDSLQKSMPLLKEKYNISDQLYNILTNTLVDFKMV
jgi:hypothetical protein